MTSASGRIVREHLPFELDRGITPRARIGLVVLSCDQTIEYEWRGILADLPGIGLFHARIAVDPIITPDSLRAMEPMIRPTTELLLPSHRFDAVAFGCTSASMVLGEERVMGLMNEAKPEAKATTPITAARIAMMALGARRIALLTPGTDLRTGKERIAGFRHAYDVHGISPDPALIRAEQSAMQFAFAEAMSLLSHANRPTAFVCLGTRILSGVLQALRHTGDSVPNDISVISIGDTDLSRLFSPSITSLSWDLEAMGTCAAQQVLKQLDRQTSSEQGDRIVIKTQLILRESCAPVAPS